MPEELYQYPIEKDEPAGVPSMRLGLSSEELVGTVQGHRASKYEEYAAWALDRMANVLGYIFQFIAVTPYTVPEHENKIDFMVNIGGLSQPIEIDHEWIHKTAEQIEYDKVRDSILNEELQGKGYLPIIRIRVNDFTTREDMYRLIQEAL